MSAGAYRIEVRVARDNPEIPELLDIAARFAAETLRINGIDFTVELIEKVGGAERVINAWMDDGG